MAEKIFTWIKTSSNDYFDRYQISIDGGSSWNDNGVDATYTWSDIPLGNQTFQVRAVNKREEYSNVLSWSFEVIKAMLLTKLDMVEVDYPWNRTFTWELTEGTLDHYEVQKDEEAWEVVGTDTSYTWNNITEESHTFRVKAIDVLDNATTIEWAFTVEVNDIVIAKDTGDFDYLI